MEARLHAFLRLERFQTAASFVVVSSVFKMLNIENIEIVYLCSFKNVLFYWTRWVLLYEEPGGIDGGKRRRIGIAQDVPHRYYYR